MLLNGYLEKVEALGPHVVNAATQADIYACRIIDLLEEIRDATATGYDVDVFEYPRLPFAGADTKIVEGREGYVKVIKSIAIVAPAAVNVDLFVGSTDSGGFAWREVVAAAGSQSKTLDLPTVEASPIYVQASAAAQVNLTIKRVQL